MNIQIQQLFSLEDIDFDGLFDSSFPDMDTNYYLLADNTGPTETKRQTYYKTLSDAMAGTSPLQKENTYVFGFKVVIDGADHLMNVGFVDHVSGVFTTHWFLTKPYNNTRSFIHSVEYKQLRSQFFLDNEIQYYQITTPYNSLLYKSIKQSNANSAVELVDEQPFDHPGVTNIVMLKFRVL
jgi:hypothetical protein